MLSRRQLQGFVGLPRNRTVLLESHTFDYKELLFFEAELFASEVIRRDLRTLLDDFGAALDSLPRVAEYLNDIRAGGDV